MAKQFEWTRLDGHSSLYEGFRRASQCIGSDGTIPGRIQWAVWYVDDLGPQGRPGCIGTGIVRGGFVGGVSVQRTQELGGLRIRWFIPS